MPSQVVVECPNRHASDLFLVEDVPEARPIVGVEEDGTIVASIYNIEQYENVTLNPRLLCGECSTEFPIPEGMSYSFGEVAESPQQPIDSRL